jgi:hypothetical protein
LSIRKLSGLASLAAALSSPAFAQQANDLPAQTTSAQGSMQVFEPAYFARYSAQTALDMVGQVPGFSLQEGDAVRGFGGAASNILINGERPSTKSSISGLLGRIATSSVVRIELVTGASATLDMRGQTKVVNLIVREDALSEPITFDFAARYTRDGRITPQLQASTRRALWGGSLNLTGVLNTFAPNGPGGGTFVDGQRARFDGTRRQTEFAEGFTRQDYVIRQLNFEYEKDMKLFALRLNGAWGASDVDGDRFWYSHAPDYNAPVTSLETNKVRNFQSAWALGGDIEKKIGDWDLKLISYNRREMDDNSTRFATYTAPGALVLATTSAPDIHLGESIVRGQANWRINDQHSVEFAAEAAYNFIDNITALVRETPTGTTSFFIDGSDTKVEELRYEFQVSDVWKIAPNLTIEPGFKFETSTIQQDVNYQTQPDRHVERDFQYPKPSITGTWRVSPTQQVRVSLEREVAQLSFADFVSVTDLVANQTTTGNVQLVPERTWAFRTEFEQRWGKGGVITLFASYDDVEDVQDFVKIGTGDGPGNIGDGTRWSVGFRATVPLDQFGLKGARIDTSLAAGGAEVTDPITGRTREFSDEFKENWTVSFRQDIPEWKMSYGFRYSDGGPGTAYRFNEASRRSREDADASIFIETTRWFGLRIRAGVDDLFPAEFARNRLIYVGDRELTPLRQIERMHSTNGVQPYIRISRKF